jgi:hypothetical protein
MEVAISPEASCRHVLIFSPSLSLLEFTFLTVAHLSRSVPESQRQQASGSSASVLVAAAGYGRDGGCGSSLPLLMTSGVD